MRKHLSGRTRPAWRGCGGDGRGSRPAAASTSSMSRVGGREKTQKWSMWTSVACSFNTTKVLITLPSPAAHDAMISPEAYGVPACLLSIRQPWAPSFRSSNK